MVKPLPTHCIGMIYLQNERERERKSEIERKSENNKVRKAANVLIFTLFLKPKINYMYPMKMKMNGNESATLQATSKVQHAKCIYEQFNKSNTHSLAHIYSQSNLWSIILFLFIQ